MRLKVLVPERTRAAFLREGEAFYLERLRHYARVEWVEVRVQGAMKGRASGAVMEAEAQALGRHLAPGEYLVALDRRGALLDSEGLAARLERLSVSPGQVTFVIGGPLGLSTTLLDRADETLSLSPLTFTHEMTRLILLEQVYRALTILRGESYHKPDPQPPRARPAGPRGPS